MPVKKGDIVDIVFPATCCSEKEIESIKNYVKNLGLIPRILLESETTPTTEENFNNEFPSHPAKERFSQLYQALENSDSSIVWCARGGYGSGDLLSFLSQTKPLKQNKLFIGFSDIVSISTFLQQNWSWKIICAPVLTQLAQNTIDKTAEEELLNLLFCKKTHFTYGLIDKNQVTNKAINSKIIGGCVSVLAGHFGTQYQVNFSDKILFLEDEGEDGERLDRYFRQINDIINEGKNIPKAIILGNFMQSNSHGTPKANNIKIAINNFIKRSNVPIFESKEQNIGHSNKMRPLILGADSRIENNELTITL